jgi:O-antigen/teichoic acid export membrane protein
MLSSLRFNVLVNNLKEMETGSAFLILNALFTYFIAAVGQFVLAHFISKQEVGYMSFGLALIGSFGFLKLAGFGIASVGSMSRGYMGVYRKSFVWQLKGRLLLFCILMGSTLVIKWRYTGNQAFFLIMLVLAVMAPWMDVDNWKDYLISKRRFGLLFSISVTVALLSLFVLIFLGLIGGSAPIIIAGKYLPLVVSGALISAWVFWKYHNSEDVEPRWVKYGLTRTSLSILGLVVSNIDKLLVGYFISFEALASVFFGEKFYSISASVFKAIEKGYASRIAMEQNDSLGIYVNRQRYMLRVILLLWALFMVCLLPYVVKYCLPQQYGDVVLLGEVYMVAWVMSIPSVLLSPVMWTHHLSGTDVRVALIFHITRLLALAVFLPTLGVVGLPVSRGFANLVNYFVLSRAIGKYTTKGRS